MILTEEVTIIEWQNEQVGVMCQKEFFSMGRKLPDRAGLQIMFL